MEEPMHKIQMLHRDGTVAHETREAKSKELAFAEVPERYLQGNYAIRLLSS